MTGEKTKNNEVSSSKKLDNRKNLVWKNYILLLVIIGFMLLLYGVSIVKLSGY